MRRSEAHSNYLTPHEGTTAKLISPFQVHPGLRAPIWKCYHYFEGNMTGLAATSVVFFKTGFLAYHHI
jgi:hypothetical protein